MSKLSKPKVLYFQNCRNVGANGMGAQVCEGFRHSLLVSESHKRLGKGWSGGGPLYVAKASLMHGEPKTVPYVYGAPGTPVINHVMWGVIPGPSLPSYPNPPSWLGVQVPVLTGHYATGYMKARPGNPVAGVGQFLIELRDLPQMPLRRLRKVAQHATFRDIPRLLRRELQDFRNLGSEYLNVVFGWKPFVSDLQKMYYLWYDIDKRMAQIIRENGKAIRRRATVLSEDSTSQTTLAANTAYINVKSPPPNVFTNGKSFLSTTVRTTQKVWFVGSFRYFIPDVTSSQWDARARLALFGALPTPELLWNVLPWSWLIDWFSNVGDVVSNMSMNAVDNLTTRYSFVMRQYSVETEWKCSTGHPSRDTSAITVRKWPAVDHVFSTTLREEYKTRLGGGNPFGLNVQLSALTGHQLGILAALGLSRGSVR